MLLKNTALDFDQKIEFNTPFKSLYYQTTVNPYPFLKDNIDRETVHIENINVPLIHFEFEVLGINESIYQSYFFMAYHYFHIIEKQKFIGINDISKIITEETGFLKRIDLYLKKQNANSQLSLF